MGRGQPSLGIKSPYRLRVGIDVPTWRGVNKEGDPGAIADDELQDAINVRILPGGGAVCRGGQEKVNTTPLDGCVMGIFDDEVPVSGARWWFGNQTSLDPITGVIGLNETNAAWTTACLFGVASPALHVQVLDKLYTWSPDTETLTLVHDFASATAIPGGNMVSAGGFLWLALWVNPAIGNVLIYKWDGTTATLDRTIAAPGKQVMFASFGGEPYYTFTSSFGLGLPVTANEVWRRVAGVWTSLAMPAVTNFAAADWAEYGGKLWLCGVSGGAGTMAAVVLSYDSATLTLERTVGNPGVDDIRATALAVLGDVLCYFYSNDVVHGTGASYVGTYDGSTWTNTAKDFLAQFDKSGDDINVVQVAFEQNGYLYAVGHFEGLGVALYGAYSGYWLVRSPAGTVVGDWTTIGHDDAMVNTFVPQGAKGYI